MTGCPYPDGFSEIDHPTLSDTIDAFEHAFSEWMAHRIGDGKFARLVSDFIADVEEADRQLKEYR